MRQDTENVIGGMTLELERARRKFPEQDAFVTLAALMEEVGELAQAVLQMTLEPKKRKTYADVAAEAQQVAVMAIRVALDCGLTSSPHALPTQDNYAGKKAAAAKETSS